MSHSNFTLEPSEQHDAAEKKRPYLFWFRIHVEINANPDFALLSNESLGVYVRILAASANQPEHGVLEMGHEGIACLLRISVPALQQALTELEERGLVEQTEDAIYIVHRSRHFEGTGLNWSDSPEGRRERQQRKRDRDRERTDSYQVEEDSRCHRDSSPCREEKSTEQHSIEANSTVTNSRAVPYREELLDLRDSEHDSFDYALEFGPEIPLD